MSKGKVLEFRIPLKIQGEGKKKVKIKKDKTKMCGYHGAEKIAYDIIDELLEKM